MFKTYFMFYQIVYKVLYIIMHFTFFLYDIATYLF